MLGGGVFVTQNKVLPGSYLNFVNASSASSTVNARGVVAIALSLGRKDDKGNPIGAGEVVELSKADFYSNAKQTLGFDSNTDNNTAKILREIFCHANKVLIFDLGGAEQFTTEDVINKFDAYEFNVLCAHTSDEEVISAYIDAVENWRDNIGKKCQVVVYNQENIDHEGVINVVSTVEEGVPYALTAWVAGAEAGCKINESCTNMLYDGEYSVTLDKTQTELETCIKNGQVAFHLVYGEVRLLEDINSLTTTTADKGEDFKYNQTIRVVDQVANDIAKLFNTKYLGRIPNNASGRVSLWADIVAHHRAMEAMGAIEAFDANLLTVEQGNTKKSVVINDVITVTNSMAQLYMTVVVQ
jgi:hypothetical protein